MSGPTPDPTAFAELSGLRQPTLTADGRRLAFYSDETGRNALCWRERRTGERHRITGDAVPRDGSQPVAWGTASDRLLVHDDGRVVAVPADGGGPATTLVDHSGHTRVRAVGDRRLLYTAAPEGPVELFCRDTTSGQTHRLQTPEGAVQAAALGPDGWRVAAVVDDDNGSRLVVGDVDGAADRRLAVSGTETRTGLTAWFPDGRRLLAHDEADGRRRVVVVDTEADDGSRHLTDGDHPTHGVGVSPDGRWVLAVENRQCRCRPVWIDVPTGSCRRPETAAAVVGAGSPLGPAVFDDGAVVAETRSDRRTGIVELPVPAGTETEPSAETEATTETVVAPPSTPVDTDSFVRAEVVTVRASGDDEFHDQSGPAHDIECLLYEPAWRPRPAPAVVKIHGGPHTQARDEFNVFEQFLAALGYTVLVPNYRGSTGYGRSFRRAIRGDWGGLDQADVADAAEWLATRDGVDGDRLVAYGVSYGGYGVYSQLVRRPSLWARGVACVGFTHLPSLFRDTDGHYRPTLYRQMGDPREEGELWRRRSPLTHVDRVDAPVAALQGVDDDRCPFDQAERFYESLPQSVADDSRLVELRGGHGTTDTDRVEQVLRAVADFLGPASAAWE